LNKNADRKCHKESQERIYQNRTLDKKKKKIETVGLIRNIAKKSIKIDALHTRTDNTIFDTFGTLVLLWTSDQQKIKIKNYFENHSMNIPAKFVSNCPSGFREEC
jgi:hypothetical protein